MNSTNHIPAEVRTAIRAFLGVCEKEAKTFATSEAIGAVRRVFPDLDISDSDLADAITSEASTAGFDVRADLHSASKALTQKSLDRWDNEGGGIGRPLRTESQRRIDNDTSGARRRKKETKERNDLV